MDTIVTNENSGGDAKYTNSYTTANGWTTVNSAIQVGGGSVINPAYPVVGPDNTHKAVCLNGKTSAPGKLTSPTLNGGISELTMVYTKMFTDVKLSVTITVTELATGNKQSHVVARDVQKDTDKYVVWTEVWTLETPVSGEFTIEVVNNCPSASTSNKDRLTVLDLTWKGAGHVHQYESVTTATCTAAGTTTYTCACGDTYTEEVAKLGHIDENLDVECDREGCTSKVAPAADSTLSLYTANCLGSKLSTSSQYYVEGTITAFENVGSGIFWISDETGERFYVRMLKDSEGNNYSTWTVKLMVGDKIRLYGKVNKFSTQSAPGGFYPSMQSGTLVEILEQHPHDFTFSSADCTHPAFCECGQSSGEALGHVDADSNNSCDRCQWRMDASLEVIVTHYDDVKGTDKVDDTNGTMVFNGTQFDITLSKGTGTLNKNSTNHIRVQKNNSLTIAATGGKKIIAITFIATTTSYVDELQAFLAAAGYTHTTDGLEVTINVESLETVTLNNTAGKIARIATVQIVYI